MLILGIDPGKTGAAAILFDYGDVRDVLEFKKMTPHDIAKSLKARSQWIQRAYIEKVASSPQMGVKSAFSFGENFGFWQGILTTLEIPYETVTPQKWQRAMQCMTKGDKNVTKRKAQQLFPKEKITHAVADSLLIAEYGRRKTQGAL